MYRGQPIPQEAAIVQRLEQYHGTNAVCEDSIHSQADSLMSERMEHDGSSVTRISEIATEVKNNTTINRDIIRAVDEFCTRKGIDPVALTAQQIEEIIHKEVRRRMLSAVNLDNSEGRYRKLPIFPKRRVWNSGYNWDGESLLLPDEFATIDQSDPNEPRPTPKKTRRARKSSSQAAKVTSVELAQGGVDVALVSSTDEPLGIVHVEDGGERDVTIFGNIDTTAIDLAVAEALLRAGYTGVQQYRMVQKVTRTVTVDRGPDVGEVRKALQGSPDGDSDAADQATEDASPDGPTDLVVGEVVWGGEAEERDDDERDEGDAAG